MGRVNVCAIGLLHQITQQTLHYKRPFLIEAGNESNLTLLGSFDSFDSTSALQFDGGYFRKFEREFYSGLISDGRALSGNKFAKVEARAAC